MLGSNAWAWLSVIFFNLLLLALALLYYFQQARLKRLSLVFGVIFGVLAGFTLLFSAQQKSYAQSQTEGIIFSPSVTVWSTPDDKQKELYLLHEGSKVGLLENSNGWYKIRLSDGNVGWVEEGVLQGI